MPLEQQPDDVKIAVSTARIAVKIAVLEEKVFNLQVAIDKQAKEYERRLAELNHAHEKQVADQSTYVSGARYEGWQGEINSWRSDVSNKFAVIEGRSGGITSTRALILQVLPMIIAILSIIAVIWGKK